MQNAPVSGKKEDDRKTGRLLCQTHPERQLKKRGAACGEGGKHRSREKEAIWKGKEGMANCEKKTRVSG